MRAPRGIGRLAAAPACLALVLVAASARGTDGGAADGDTTASTDDARAAAEEVEAFLRGYLAALEARDEEAVRATIAGGGRFRWFTDGALSYASADEVVAGMRRFAAMRFETELEDVRVAPLGARHASASAHFRTELQIPGADDHAYGGVITWVVERANADAPWRILTGHTSTPGGPPGGAERDAGGR